jgi:RNA-directed DNA polymerase
MPGPEGKSFAISKLMVWEAWRRVRANKGAPGVDGQDLGEFEADLGSNLYRIWNRMSSGSYFPPPVKAVEIPKPHGGGVRMLGVPTIADRVARTVVVMHLEERADHRFTRTPMAIGRAGRPTTRSRHAGSGAGRTTG